MRAPVAWLVAGLLAACSGCAGSGDGAPRPTGPPRHLVLVSLDTLRADRLGCYGYERDTSPTLDRLASEGARFAHAISETSWTLPAHATLFTALAPRAHGVVLPELALGDDVPVLAEVLREEGFRTFAGTEGAYVSRRYGFARGFERWDDEQTSFAQTLEDARRFLALLDEGERAFLFLHTYAIHCPYDPPERYTRMFRSAGAEPLEVAGRCGNPDFNRLDLSPAQFAFLSDQYDAGIRAADEALSAFVDWLDATERADEVLWIVTSDHGEELGERGQVGHERSLHDELLRVPLIVRGPGVAPAVRDVPVGLADVAPLALEAADPVPGVWPPVRMPGLFQLAG